MEKLLLFINTIIVINSYCQQTWEVIYNNHTATTFTQLENNSYVLSGAEYEAMFQKWNIFQVDTGGVIMWDSLFYHGNNGAPTSIIAIPDTGYYIFGNEGADGYILRFDSMNNLIWESYFDLNNAITITSTTPSFDNNFIHTGQIDASNTGLLLLKTDNLGDTIWTRSYFYDYYAIGLSVTKAFDSTYFCIGSNVDTDIWLVKFNELGDTLWSKNLDYGSHANPKSILQTPDSCLIICGTTNNDDEMLFMKINKNGDVIWTKTYSSPYPDIQCSSIATTNDSGFICSFNMYNISHTECYPCIVKLNDVGDTTWTLTSNIQLTTNKIIQSNDDDYIFLANDHQGIPRLVKIDSLGNGFGNISFNNEIISDKHTFSITPNPFDDQVEVVPGYIDNDGEAVISIIDACGRSVYERIIYDNNSFFIDTAFLNEGLYFINIKTNKNYKSVKMIKK